MGGKIPTIIKRNVLRGWLLGYSRDSIAKNNNIGTGTVTSIIKEAKIEIADIDLLREVAALLKKGNVNISYFASSIRLKNILDELKITEDEAISLLEEIKIHCFKTNVSEKEFISKIDEVSIIAKNFKVSIFDIPHVLSQKRKDIDSLNGELNDLKRQIRRKIWEYVITVDDLEAYKRERPLNEEIKNLHRKLNAKAKQIFSLRKDISKYKVKVLENDYTKSVPEGELIELNRHLPPEKQIGINKLFEIYEDLYHRPSKYSVIIELMLDISKEKEK